MGKAGARETITRKAFPGVLMRQLEKPRFQLSGQDRALKTPAQPPHFTEEVTGAEGENDFPRATVTIRAATRSQVSGHHNTLPGRESERYGGLYLRSGRGQTGLRCSEPVPSERCGGRSLYREHSSGSGGGL